MDRDWLIRKGILTSNIAGMHQLYSLEIPVDNILAVYVHHAASDPVKHVENDVLRYQPAQDSDSCHHINHQRADYVIMLHASTDQLGGWVIRRSYHIIYLNAHPMLRRSLVSSLVMYILTM